MVKAPSASLLEAIGKGGNLSVSHKAELKNLMLALERRFGNDLTAIRTGQGADLATKHRLDAKQLERTKGALKVLDEGQNVVRAEARAKDKAQVQERGGPVR